MLTLRLWPNASDEPWKASVKDIGGSILCGASSSALSFTSSTFLPDAPRRSSSISFVRAVSQFTLQAKVKKGSKPDFHSAMVRLSFFSLVVLLALG